MPTITIIHAVQYDMIMRTIVCIVEFPCEAIKHMGEKPRRPLPLHSTRIQADIAYTFHSSISYTVPTKQTHSFFMGLQNLVMKAFLVFVISLHSINTTILHYLLPSYIRIQDDLCA
jgi:hypothetical protein